jgi:hypothetical protein
MSVTPFEEKEIRGITGRLVRGIIWQTVIYVAIACSFYFSILGKVDRLYTLREDAEKYYQLKFEQISIQNNILSKQIDEINLRLMKLQEQQNK